MSTAFLDARIIGQSIKALRMREHLTQIELADAVGYSVRSLRRIERDGTDSLEVVNIFAEAFKVSAIDILNGCLLFYMKKGLGEFPHTALTPICYSCTFTPG